MRLSRSNPKAVQSLFLAWILGLVCGATSAMELSDPASVRESVMPPMIVADPARPAQAPDEIAIRSVLDEDGADAGLILATRALDASRLTYGTKDARTLTPLINQAHLRQRGGDTAGALKDYRAAIDLAEASGGPRDAQLFSAWYGTGYAYLAANQPQAAAPALETALQLHRVNHGLYSAAQLEILHALAQSARGIGKIEDADELQRRRIEVAERVHGTGTVPVAQTYIAVGRWYREIGRAESAVALHGLAVQTLERFPKEQPGLIQALLELAVSGTGRRRDMDEMPLLPALRPTNALTRAEKLLDENKTLTPAQHADLRLRLGDAQQLIGRQDAALRSYAKVRELFAAQGKTPPFDSPAFIRLQLPVIEPVSGPGGFLLAEFDVDTKGRASNIRIVEAQPNDLPAGPRNTLSNALKAAQLRPKLDKNQPVATKGMRYRLAVRGDSA